MSRILPTRALVTALAAFVLLGGAAHAARPSSDSPLPDLDLETFTLPNGLGVIFHEDHSTPIVGVNLWYHVGSGAERPGRTGFAHLFEHMMFQGSGHQDHEYIEQLQGMGAFVNGSTNEDRTNYIQVVPRSRLEATLLLEADRMGWLLDAMTEEKLANQKEVVRNERRESEGRPYSAFWLNLNEAFYPKGHPYDHSVIGVHEDLANATLDDVKEFFRTYYTPNNATLCISGDFDPAQTRTWIETYFGPIPAGPPVERVTAWMPAMNGEKRIRYQDRVQLPRLSWCWHTPAAFAEGDADVDFAASILGSGRTSRLYKRLVHEEKLAQSVSFRQASQQVSSIAMLDVTLRPGADEARVEVIVQEELDRFAAKGPTAAELERALRTTEASFVRGLQRVGGFGGLDDRLNRYNHYVGTPDYLQQDWERYASRTRGSVQAAAERWLGADRLFVAIAPFPGGEVLAADVDRTKLPEPGPADTFREPDVARSKLPNGMDMVSMRHDELPLVQLQLVFASGTSADPADLEGVCQLAGSMHFEGTTKRDKFAFENALEELGADVDVFSGADRTVFSMQCLADRMDASMALLAEALLSPSFPASEFEDLKQRTLMNLKRQSDQPQWIAARVTQRILFGDGHPYSRMGSGTPASIDAISLDDVRRFSGEAFTPGNATLVVVGAVDPEVVQRAFGRHFAAWTGAAPARTEFPEPAAPKGRTVYLVDKPGDTQSTISIAQLGLARSDPRWEETYVANRIFGGFFSSRLNLNLREDKGWTYGVRSTLDAAAHRSALLVAGRVQAEVTAPALTEFLGEIEGAAGKRPFTAKELDFAKDSIVLGYPQQFETVGQLAGALADQIVYGLPNDAFARYPERIAAVSLEDANRAGREFLQPRDLAIVVIGDLAKIEKSVTDLKLGPVVHLDRDGNRLDTATAMSSR